MSELRPYPEYQDSGHEWFGQIPAGWRPRRFKFGFELMKRPITADMGIVTAFRDGQVTLRSNRRIEGYTEGDKQIGYQGVEPGDLVIHAMDAFAGAIGVSDSHGKSTPVYSVCRPKSGFNANYFALVLQHMARVGYIESLAKGIRERSTDFRWADAKEVWVPVPPHSEQQDIVEYLNRETAEIDKFIADQQELINLLEQRRFATITRAVTQGVKADSSLDDSGYEWIGPIRTDWSLMPLKRHLQAIEQGVSPEALAQLADESSVGVLKAGCVNYGVFRDTEHKALFDGFNYDQKLEVNEGDLLLNRASGSPDLVGSAAIVRTLRYKLILSDKIFRLKIAPGTSARYLEKYFHSFIYRFQVRAAISGAEGLANNLPSSSLKRFLVPTPPLEEQEAIADYLDRETTEIEAAIVDAREAIALSRERRAALISAAVTGKIDVRKLTERVLETHGVA